MEPKFGSPKYSSRIKIIAPGLILFLLLNSAHLYGSPQEQSAGPSDRSNQNAGAPQPQPTSSQPSGDVLPDSPGAVQSPAPVSRQQTFVAEQQPQPRPQPQSPPQPPVGTAAAESIPIVGVAASRPAGAAVAPAKQRRVRSILIKVGAVVGVGAAVGATVALSQGSPSRPPGAR
jgi:hypothetical protein